MDTVVGWSLLLFFVGCIAFVVYVVPRQNRHFALDAARLAVKKHLRTLERVRSQMSGTDNYGNYQDRGWVNEATYFLNTEVPAAHRKNLKPVDIEILLNEELAKDPERHEKEDFARRFARVTTGVQFEHFVKDELVALGWQVRHIGGAGDQGADLIASRSGVRVAVQCKLYSKALDNKSVQEVVAGRKFHDTQAAVVISNQPFNKSAAALAKANDVVHIPHDDLIMFDLLFGSAVSQPGTATEIVDPFADDIKEQAARITTSGELIEHASKMLHALDWNVSVIMDDTFRGSDLIASIGDYKVAVQCKLYASPLREQFVKEVASAREYYGTQAAIIISNQPLDAAAQMVAEAEDVQHIPYDDIARFHWIFEPEARRHNAA